MNAPAVSKPSPLARVKEQFETRQGEFALALPQHIPVERFVRVVMTAVQRNPDLANADRVSLFNAALLAAQDGLLPDGRDGALVIYNTRVKGKDGERDQWVSAVQWMPMIAGVLKKARNSGELSSIEAHIVREADEFRFTIGVDDIPFHNPNWFGDRGKVIGVYAFAKLKDGTRQCEVMSYSDVEKVRSASKSKDKGPWVDWWEEMARKTALRRLLKRLPTSADLDDLIRRDDALYDFEGARAEAKHVTGGSLATRMAALTSQPGVKVAEQQRQTAPTIDHDPDTGEINDEQNRGSSPGGAKGAEDKPARPSAPARSKEPPKQDEDERKVGAANPVAEEDNQGDFPGDRPSLDQQIEEAYQRGMKARTAKVGRRAIPGEYRDSEDLASAWERGWDDGEGAQA